MDMRAAYLVFIGPFADAPDKKMSDFRGLFYDVEETMACAKKFLPRNNTHKAQIHKCAGCYTYGLTERTMHAALWWDETGNDWKLLISSQSRTNGHRLRQP